jgi:hypothetical protein
MLECRQRDGARRQPERELQAAEEDRDGGGDTGESSQQDPAPLGRGF